MLALDHEIGFSEIALVELAGGTLTSFADLNANSSGDSTLIFDAISSVDFALAGQSTSTLGFNAYAQLGLTTSGSSVFTVEVQELISATLAAAGAAQVLFESISDSQFAIVGVGAGNFVGEAVTFAAFATSGSSATSLAGVTVTSTGLSAAGTSTSTIIFSAQVNVDLTAAGTTTSALALQAYGQQQFEFQGVSAFSPTIVGLGLTTLVTAGSSDTSFDVEKLILGSFQIAGATQLVLNANSTGSTNFSMVGQANGSLLGAVLYDELPRAWDYVIRPYELRGINRPYEDRTVKYS